MGNRIERFLDRLVRALAILFNIPEEDNRLYDKDMTVDIALCNRCGELWDRNQYHHWHGHDGISWVRCLRCGQIWDRNQYHHWHGRE